MQEDGNGTGGIPEPRTWRGYAQLALVVVVLAAALYFAQAPSFREPPGDAAPAASSAPPVVEVVVPAVTKQSLTVKLTGTVSVPETTTVVSEVEGRVAWVSPDFTNGGSIAAGEPMLRIDPAAFELMVVEAQAAVDAAAARVALEVAQGVENVRALALADSEAEPSAWVRRLPHLVLARAELRQAQAVLGLTELQLARTEISLPYAVRVMAADAAVGEWASPEESSRPAPLGVVYRAGALQVRAPVEPGELAYLEPVVGRAVRVTGRLGVWTGTVARVSSVVNPASRLVSVFIDFTASESLDALPLPGTFVEIAIEGPVFADVYVLPNTVLQQQNSVWVVRDGQLNLFTPEAHGRTDDGWVVQAFDADEGIVVGSLPGAREGLEVSVQVVQEAQ